MAFYYYEARNRASQKKSGVLAANNEKELVWQLKQSGLVPTKIRLREKKRLAVNRFSFLFFRRVSLVEQIMFTRHLAVMVKGGISLPEAIGILAAQVKSPYFAKVLNSISDNVVKGVAFSEALAAYPAVFSRIYISMVEVGEVLGKLDASLTLLADQMAKDNNLQKKVKGAMIYPAVILGAMFAIGIVMMTVVIPRIATLFEDLQIELPLMTRIVIEISNFLRNHVILLLLFVLALVFGARFFYQSRLGRNIVDYLALKIPGMGGIIIKINSASFCRSFASLLNGGVPIVRSLNIVSETVSNVHYKRAIKRAAGEVKKGVSLNMILKENMEIFPSLLVQMVRVGEETGMSGEVLGQLADFYEGEVDDILKNLSSIIEPVLMIIIGVVVGFFAISMLQPMYSLIDTL